MTEREALKLALEWFEQDGEPDHHPVVTAIKEALAQPQPWEKFCDSNCVWTDHHRGCKLAQPEQEPLALKIAIAVLDHCYGYGAVSGDMIDGTAKAVSAAIAAHGIKGQP